MLPLGHFTGADMPSASGVHASQTSRPFRCRRRQCRRLHCALWNLPASRQSGNQVARRSAVDRHEEALHQHRCSVRWLSQRAAPGPPMSAARQSRELQYQVKLAVCDRPATSLKISTEKLILRWRERRWSGTTVLVSLYIASSWFDFRSALK